MSALLEPDGSTDALAHQVIGAAIEVHRQLGPGFLEGVYERALCAELRLRGLPFVRQFPVRIHYKGERVGLVRIDLVVGERLVVELKAVRDVLPIHRAIAVSYLKATRLRLALLINFRVARLREGVQRVVLT